MPLPPPSRMPSGPRRRSLLVSAAGTVLLAGCSDSPATNGRRPSPEDRARARAARDSRRLAEHYDAVIAAHPGLGGRLTPLRAEVLLHVGAFEAGKEPSGRPATESVGEAGSEASSGATPSATTSPRVAVPADEKAALAELADAERVLAERRSRALLDAQGELARLLASVAAAGAAHVYLLTEGDR